MEYFTADLHLGHPGILKHRTQFSSVDEMDQVIINNIKKTITKKDTLYILGDCTHRIKTEEANKLLSMIKGHKILIRGNHDLKYDESLFDEITEKKEITRNKRTFVLCHYPLICWKNMKWGAVNLHGHFHSNPSYNEYQRNIGRLQFDVGVDPCNFKPVSIVEIEEWCNTSPWKTYEGKDHHIFR